MQHVLRRVKAIQPRQKGASQGAASEKHEARQTKLGSRATLSQSAAVSRCCCNACSSCCTAAASSYSSSCSLDMRVNACIPCAHVRTDARTQAGATRQGQADVALHGRWCGAGDTCVSRVQLAQRLMRLERRCPCLVGYYSTWAREAGGLGRWSAGGGHR